MKKIALISALALSGLFYNKANAQIRISLGLHLPVAQVAVQAPVYADYNSSDDYYYLPDVDAYYSVAEQSYYYNDGANWISAAYLPGEYRDYDWRNARRYEVRAHRPYLNANFYRDRFKGNVGNWSRYSNHNDNYANRDFNRYDRDRNVNALHADQRNWNNNRGEEHADNRSWGNGNRDNRFDNTGRDNGNRNDHFDNRNQGNHDQPSQPNRSDNNNQQPNRNQGGNNQPSNQNGRNSQPRDNGAGQQHYTDNNRGQNNHDRIRS